MQISTISKWHSSPQATRTRPLLIPPLDLRTPLSWQYWIAFPSAQEFQRWPEFFRYTPAIPVPDLLACLLGRSPSHVSLRASERLELYLRHTAAKECHSTKSALQTLPLRQHRRVWQYTHSDWTAPVFSDSIRRSRRRPECSILVHIAEWWPHGTPVEGRFLLAGLMSQTNGDVYRARLMLRNLLGHGQKAGWLGPTIDRQISLSALRFSKTWYVNRGWEVPPLHSPSLDHNLLAISAALLRTAVLEPEGRVLELRTDHDTTPLLPELPRQLIGKPVRPDCAVRMSSGRVRAFELISDTYTNDLVDRKIEGLGFAADLIATSRRVARRIAFHCMTGAVYHF